jgi:hypothetical protein
MQFSPSNQHGNRHSTPVRRCTDDGLWLTTLGGGASAEVNMSNKTMLCAGLLAVWKRPFEWPQRADCCQFSLPPLTRQPEILNLDSCQSRPAGSGRNRVSIIPMRRGFIDAHPHSPALSIQSIFSFLGTWSRSDLDVHGPVLCGTATCCTIGIHGASSCYLVDGLSMRSQIVDGALEQALL